MQCGASFERYSKRQQVAGPQPRQEAAGCRRSLARNCSLCCTHHCPIVPKPSHVGAPAGLRYPRSRPRIRGPHLLQSAARNFHPGPSQRHVNIFLGPILRMYNRAHAITATVSVMSAGHMCVCTCEHPTRPMHHHTSMIGFQMNMPKAGAVAHLHHRPRNPSPVRPHAAQTSHPCTRSGSGSGRATVPTPSQQTTLAAAASAMRSRTSWLSSASTVTLSRSSK